MTPCGVPRPRSFWIPWSLYHTILNNDKQRQIKSINNCIKNIWAKIETVIQNHLVYTRPEPNSLSDGAKKRDGKRDVALRCTLMFSPKQNRPRLSLNRVWEKKGRCCGSFSYNIYTSPTVSCPILHSCCVCAILGKSKSCWNQSRPDLWLKGVLWLQCLDLSAWPNMGIVFLCLCVHKVSDPWSYWDVSWVSSASTMISWQSLSWPIGTNGSHTSVAKIYVSCDT